MRQLTEAELAVSANLLKRDTAARLELTATTFSWPERALIGVALGGAIFLSGHWQELPTAASVLLAVCAGTLPYFYFELRRLRKQVNALTQLVLHAKHSDA